ncbi:MAG: cobalamin B12-binding domain-containing protein, partial [Leptonema sp. (in: Bacteria)]|nr:cobalamin B12-binding domain-containing protein [Leptonema sp. (in: bacteria)]
MQVKEQSQAIYQKNQTNERLRILSAASLFDGHDAAIHLIRRLLQDQGVEIIHIGHNRSAEEIVDAAIEEGVHAIALTSYQGGHNEFFKYMFDLLKKKDAEHIKIFGGGGGTILPTEIESLQSYGIERLYHPDDGRSMGLVGMIQDVIDRCPKQRPSLRKTDLDLILKKDAAALSRMFVAIEHQFNQNSSADEAQVLSDLLNQLKLNSKSQPAVIGITGPGGSGKSSLTDELVRRLLDQFQDLQIGILSIDPTRKKTGGALLGDRIRMNSIASSRVFMRSLATGGDSAGLSKLANDFLVGFRLAGFDLILLETAGIGQADSAVSEISDLNLYVMTPEYGASTQLEKIGMLDYADLIAVNKSDRRGAEDALFAVQKQYRRNHHLFDEPLERMPVFATTASRFRDGGVDRLFDALIQSIHKKTNINLEPKRQKPEIPPIIENPPLIPQRRIHYLQEIVDDAEKYQLETKTLSKKATELQSLQRSIEVLTKNTSNQDLNYQESNTNTQTAIQVLTDRAKSVAENLPADLLKLLEEFPKTVDSYRQAESGYTVRNKEIRVANYTKSLSGLSIPKIATPKFSDAESIVRWSRSENFPGKFPFTAGIYPFKRTEEDPIRMFAGEGGPERTNRRFHYLSTGMPAIRLSTAFDSVTLYGEDPDSRPDIFGKVGNSGVSVCSLDDAKRLYSGFRLCDPLTSVSMTINGPAPIILAFYFNAAIDQECEIYLR